MAKRTDRIHPEHLIAADFRKFTGTDLFKLTLILLKQSGIQTPIRMMYKIYTHSWWDGRASKFNLKPVENPDNNGKEKESKIPSGNPS